MKASRRKQTEEKNNTRGGGEKRKREEFLVRTQRGPTEKKAKARTSRSLNLKSIGTPLKGSHNGVREGSIWALDQKKITLGNRGRSRSDIEEKLSTQTSEAETSFDRVDKTR